MIAIALVLLCILEYFIMFRYKYDLKVNFHAIPITCINSCLFSTKALLKIFFCSLFIFITDQRIMLLYRILTKQFDYFDNIKLLFMLVINS